MEAVRACSAHHKYEKLAKNLACLRTRRAKTTESSGSALMAYLGNMKKYLGTDLSATGIQGASGLLGKAKSRAATFKHDLVKLDRAASRLSNDLKPTAGVSK